MALMRCAAVGAVPAKHTVTHVDQRRLASGASSGAGHDALCGWLYGAFQSGIPALQLAVLRFVPTLAGVYMSRAVSRKPLAGFEAVILTLYAHAVAQRGAGEAETVALPNMANPSVYHEAVKPAAAPAAAKPAKPADPDPDVVAELAPALEPHGTMRATRRARIVGAVLELYHGRLALMPLSSKMDFCEFCVAWSGKHGNDKPRVASAAASARSPEGGEEKWRRVPLPWELFQPALRIVGHCLSLIRLSQMVEEPIPEPSFNAIEANMADMEAMRANILSANN
ncbi:hypothetical protein ACQ4PT_071540 [Festuca glaucescens]